MEPPNWLGNYPVLPIINHTTPYQALHIAEALLQGGVEIMEITLRTEAAKDSLLAIRKEFPNLLLGVGSVMTVEQIQWIHDEGMQFAVSPGWSDKCWQKAVSLNLSFFPGILTPSELMHAIDAGCLCPKIFPIGPAGGVKYLSTLLAPFRKIKLQCIPTGGIAQKMVSEFLLDPQVTMVGGSWLTPKGIIEKKDFSGITELAKSSLMFANNRR